MPGQEAGTLPSTPCGWQWPKYLSYYRMPVKLCIGRKLDWKQSRQGSIRFRRQVSNWWPNLICHNDHSNLMGVSLCVCLFSLIVLLWNFWNMQESWKKWTVNTYVPTTYILMYELYASWDMDPPTRSLTSPHLSYSLCAAKQMANSITPQHFIKLFIGNSIGIVKSFAINLELFNYLKGRERGGMHTPILWFIPPNA